MANKINAIAIKNNFINFEIKGPISKKTSRARSLINNIVITDAIVQSGFFIFAKDVL